MKQEEIRRLSVERLKELCSEQTRLFEAGRVSDERYCYELFRRAVFGIDQAWEAIDVLYRPWLARKIARYYQGNPADIDDLTQDAMMVFFRNVTPGRWAKFPDLRRLLAYWGTCIHHRTLNHRRDQGYRRVREVAFPEDTGEDSFSSPIDGPERHVATRELQEQIWAIISSHCKHPNDHLLAQEIWVYHIKPQEIVSRHPQKFPTPQDVYKQKRNLLDRLKRDSEFKALLKLYAPN